MDDRPFDAQAASAVARTGSASAAIFLVDETGKLSLAGAAGIEGAPLDALVDAVRSREHPIAQTAADGHTAFDVAPIAPGGPALRSHIAIVASDSARKVIGVLALAHQLPLNSEQRRAATDVAMEISTAP